METEGGGGRDAKKPRVGDGEKEDCESDCDQEDWEQSRVITVTATRLTSAALALLENDNDDFAELQCVAQSGDANAVEYAA